MKYLRNSIPGALLMGILPLLAWAKTNATPDQPQPRSKQAQAENPDRGQQVFQQNCSRCHNTPDGFSPRISAAVAQHMRVRAGLSEQDYKALRRFLNP